jgi:hypothetical protein
MKKGTVPYALDDYELTCSVKSAYRKEQPEMKSITILSISHISCFL